MLKENQLLRKLLDDDDGLFRYWLAQSILEEEDSHVCTKENKQLKLVLHNCSVVSDWSQLYFAINYSIGGCIEGVYPTCSSPQLRFFMLYEEEKAGDDSICRVGGRVEKFILLFCKTCVSGTDTNFTKGTGSRAFIKLVSHQTSHDVYLYCQVRFCSYNGRN